MEKRSKDSIGNIYYLKKLLKNRPSYKTLTVICAQRHTARLQYLFDVFFDNSYRIHFMGVNSKGDYTDEKRLLRQTKSVLSGVRPGHEEDFKHRPYVSKFYRSLA